MLPSKYGQFSMRNTKPDSIQRPSMLPKPRRPQSSDRLSIEMRRPSVGGQRSNSAEPNRNTFAGGRLSREGSATNLLPYGRSRLQQSNTPLGFRTPLQPTRHYARATITPRTPSQDRSERNWQSSVERALNFHTVKDQRPITSVAWQRSECARVSEALSAMEGTEGATLVRPLTIARFVDITGRLFNALMPGTKLTIDNYIIKVPAISKRLLYPGTINKAWLRTVNTLHAFPQALALIAYLLDLVKHVETPVPEEVLYVHKDELACLRREYLTKCWMRFQSTDPHYEDLDDEYLAELKEFLGNDEEKIAELKRSIQELLSSLNSEEDMAAKAEESRLLERRDVLASALRAQRALRHADRNKFETLKAELHAHVAGVKQLDAEIERITADSEQLDVEINNQPLTVEQRSKLLADMDYSMKVYASKRALAEQIAKMVTSKETDLTLWQKKTLDSCLKYKQGLIHLSGQFPDLANLAIDENELMSPECASKVSRAVDVLRARTQKLSQKSEEHAREKSVLSRRRAILLEESRAKVVELRSLVKREQEALDAEISRESVEAAAAAAELRVLNAKLEDLKMREVEYQKVDNELRYWEQQDQLWLTNLESLQEFIKAKHAESQRLLVAAIEKRAQTLGVCVNEWKAKLVQSQ